MKGLTFSAVFAGLMASTALNAQANSTVEAAGLFGAREAIQQASLSPDGKSLAYLGPIKGQGSVLFIADLDGQSEPQPVLVASGKPERLSQCNWVANARLICTIFGVTQIDAGEIAYFSRLVAVDRDGKNMTVLQQRGGTGEQYGIDLSGGKVIDWLPDGDGSVLMARSYLKEDGTGTLLSSQKEGLGVDRVNTRTLKSASVETPGKDNVEYITDGYGTVRIKGVKSVASSGYDKGQVRYFYRPADGGGWKPLSTVGTDIVGFDPNAVDRDQNVAYGLKKLNGRYAAYKMSLDGSNTETLLFAHPEVDVGGFVRMGRRERVVGVRYSTDRAQVKYFDPAFEKLAAGLSKAIRNLPLIHFVDFSLDEKKLLIWASSDTDPGRYFMLDRNGGQLAEVMPARPQLARTKLASVKPITYPAADGTSIPGYLTLPPGKESAKGLPAIVMPHGGPGARDDWGFDWLAQFYANRGYAVLQPNFRGSAGYGDEWFQKNGFRNWRTAIGDVNDGGRWLIGQGIADPEKIAILGWSYGGYAALQSAVTEPGLFKAAVAIAPVTDLEDLKEARRGWTDYNVVSEFVGSGPHIKEGSPALNADRIKAPVLMFHGTLDRNVRLNQARLMSSRLKAVNAEHDLVIYEGLDHYLDDADARTDMLRRSEEFLKKSLKL